ncbi:MAG: PTS sugar transporter subunit IIA [Stenotrophobium sp.]
MKVGLLLVTHGKLGRHMLDTMTEMMGALPLATDVLEVRRVQSPEAMLSQGGKTLERLDSGAGVLILTDAFGSTPSNIANRLNSGEHTRVVAGINLPMLVRIVNYPQLSLAEMALTAVEGGQRGIVNCPRAAGDNKK